MFCFMIINEQWSKNPCNIHASYWLYNGDPYNPLLKSLNLTVEIHLRKTNSPSATNQPITRHQLMGPFSAAAMSGLKSSIYLDHLSRRWFFFSNPWNAWNACLFLLEMISKNICKWFLLEIPWMLGDSTQITWHLFWRDMVVLCPNAQVKSNYKAWKRCSPKM